MLNTFQGLRAIVTPKQHIFLLGHMRAYTSLFGHIMGSNPAICGYYEMHIGYHSWKSLYRQKILYFEQEDSKPGFSHMFDKVLHNDHAVSPDILNSQKARTIFSLRRPQQTIPSILKLYASVDPEHEFNSEAFATQYYISRLETLEALAKQVTCGFFYFDAETLKSDSAKCLSGLSEWLDLPTPLSQNYTMQKKTSQQRFGDSSDRMKAGRITTDKPTYTASDYNAELMDAAASTHQRVRQILLEKSASHCMTQTLAN
ncbi:MAG: hypothetical protein ACI9JM_000035 [Halioglobus sp.]|jgi:hypothetical protein